jgi:sterol-4alpha-carboxylate 3-dehydrogenase (decarboxylating)
MARKRIVVTGGHGFVGCAIIDSLKQSAPDCSIAIIDKSSTSIDSAVTEGLDFAQVDITSQSQVDAAFAELKPDLVIHSAGFVPLTQNHRYSRSAEEQVKRVNVGGTRNVVNAAIQSGCSSLIYTSSCCVVTDDLHGYFANIDETWPVSVKSLPYGESKVEAERIVLAANTDTFHTCVLRPAVIFGEKDYQLVPSIHACIAKRETPYRLGKGYNLWDTVYVGNVGHAHALAAANLFASKSAAGEVFFIQNNEPVPFRDFCLALWKEFGHQPPFEIEVPQALGYFAGYILEAWSYITGTTATISRGSVLDACATRYASGEKAERLLGYTPIVGLEDGLQRSCQVS